MLVDNVCLTIGIVVAHIFGLFQGHLACDGTAVRKISIILIFSRGLDKDNRFCLFAIGGSDYFTLGSNFFKFIIGDNVGKINAQMGIGLSLKFVWTPTGSQNHGTVKFACGVYVKYIFTTFIVLKVLGVLGFCIQLIALFIQQHCCWQWKGNVKGNFFPRLFKGDGELTGLTGNTGNFCAGFYLNVGILFQLRQLVLNHCGDQGIKGFHNGHLAAHLGRISTQCVGFFHNGDFITGFGRIKGR